MGDHSQIHFSDHYFLKIHKKIYVQFFDQIISMTTERSDNPVQTSLTDISEKRI